ncbi:MAG: hypothetical protein ACREPA_09620 [Candidatus Dormibacteraceae bacterium]
MTFLVAWVALLAGLLLALWPVIRHRRPVPPREPAPGGDGSASLLAAGLEEIELDLASGRLSSEEAAARRAEAIATAERRS